MEKILDDVRRDAITKLKMSEKNVEALAEAADRVMLCARISRRNGLLALESEAKYTDSEFLRFVMMMVVNACEQEVFAEEATNAYWATQPEGVWAMVDYIYLRGMLLVQQGEPPDWSIAPLLQSLIPKDLRSEFRERMALKEQRRKEIVDKYAQIQRPVFRDTKLLEKIHTLERTLPQENWERAWTLARKFLELEKDDLLVCMYLLDKELQIYILDIFRNLYSAKYMCSIMKDILRYHQVGYEEADMIKSISVLLSRLT